MMERIGEGKNGYEVVKAIRDRIYHDKDFGVRFLDIIAVSARWAEYNLKELD